MPRGGAALAALTVCCGRAVRARRERAEGTRGGNADILNNGEMAHLAGFEPAPVGLEPTALPLSDRSLSGGVPWHGADVRGCASSRSRRWCPGMAMSHVRLEVVAPQRHAAQGIPAVAREGLGGGGGGLVVEIRLPYEPQPDVGGLEPLGHNHQRALVGNGKKADRIRSGQRLAEMDAAFLRRVGALDDLMFEGEVGTDDQVQVPGQLLVLCDLHGPDHMGFIVDVKYAPGGALRSGASRGSPREPTMATPHGSRVAKSLSGRATLRSTGTWVRVRSSPAGRGTAFQ